MSEPVGRPCPRCAMPTLTTQVRGFNNLAVTAETWLVCRAEDGGCGYEKGPFHV